MHAISSVGQREKEKRFELLLNAKDEKYELKKICCPL